MTEKKSAVKESAIKYALIEMIKNNETKLVATSIVVGLFKGIKCEAASTAEDAKQQVFILLEEKDKAIRALALDYYNIMSLEKYDGMERTVTFFRASEEDQNAAFDMAANIVNELHVAERTVKSDENIIDITTYTEIPAVYGTSLESREANTAKSHIGGLNTTRSTVQNNHVGTVYKKKEPEPFFFKRKGRALAQKTLETMRNKVLQIAIGQYEPVLPEIDGEEGEEDFSMSDDDYRAQYLCCG
jgi:hypothetical protein